MTIKGKGGHLKAIDYTLPMASAQVKSCVLLAGFMLKGQTCAEEPAPTRDHTERMLNGFGYEVKSEKLDEQRMKACLQGGGKLTWRRHIDVPSDISSAAFFMVAAAVRKSLIW